MDGGRQSPAPAGTGRPPLQAGRPPRQMRTRRALPPSRPRAPPLLAGRPPSHNPRGRSTHHRKCGRQKGPTGTHGDCGRGGRPMGCRQQSPYHPAGSGSGRPRFKRGAPRARADPRAGGHMRAKHLRRSHLPKGRGRPGHRALASKWSMAARRWLAKWLCAGHGPLRQQAGHVVDLPRPDQPQAPHHRGRSTSCQSSGDRRVATGRCWRAPAGSGPHLRGPHLLGRLRRLSPQCLTAQRWRLRLGTRRPVCPLPGRNGYYCYYGYGYGATSEHQFSQLFRTRALL